MTAASHSSVILGLAVTSLVSVAYAHPRWILYELRRQPLARSFVDGVARSTEQDEGHARNALFQRFVAKRAIARNLIRGELTLIEAALAFREINDACYSALLHADYRRTAARTVTDDLFSQCEQVIYWVADELGPPLGSSSHELLTRLRAELEQHRRCSAGSEDSANVSL